MSEGGGRREELRDARHLRERDPEVDGRELALQAFAIALDQAAGDNNLLACASLLVLERFLDCGCGFADCGLEKCAGGDDDEVGRTRLSCETVPGLGQRAEYVLRVNLVLGTTEKDNTGGITNGEFLMTNQ